VQFAFRHSTTKLTFDRTPVGSIRKKADIKRYDCIVRSPEEQKASKLIEVRRIPRGGNIEVVILATTTL
jgi:hypothetical protein